MAAPARDVALIKVRLVKSLLFMELLSSTDCRIVAAMQSNLKGSTTQRHDKKLIFIGIVMMIRIDD
jgi:hypothetical protein